jgi:hypothetical protein
MNITILFLFKTQAMGASGSHFDHKLLVYADISLEDYTETLREYYKKSNAQMRVAPKTPILEKPQAPSFNFKINHESSGYSFNIDDESAGGVNEAQIQKKNVSKYYTSSGAQLRF